MKPYDTPPSTLYFNQNTSVRPCGSTCFSRTTTCPCSRRRGRSASGSRPAVEVKNSRTWRPQYGQTVNEFLAAGRLTRGFVVYRGSERYRSGAVDGLPVEDFLSAIYTEEFHGDS